MITLKRNKVAFYYAPFIKSERVKDENGRNTADFRLVYGEPVKAYANVSAEKGEAGAELFGWDLDYDKVLVFGKEDIPFDEYSVLAIDKELSFDDDENFIYDYVIRKIARSLNYVAVAVSKVKVS